MQKYNILQYKPHLDDKNWLYAIFFVILRKILKIFPAYALV